MVCLSSCSSNMILVVMIPLILVSGYLIFMGPNNNSYSSTSWISLSSSSSVSSSSSLSAINENHQANLTKRVVIGTVHHIEEEEEAISEPFTFNLSSSPPHNIEFHQHAEEIIKQNGSIKSSIVKFNLSNFDTDGGRKGKKQSKLQYLEAGLAKTRSIIKQVSQYGTNQTSDPDYVPVGPIYWNSNAFHRSYLEMEKQFKIFIYEEGEPPLFHSGPCKSIYSIEGNFIHQMEMEQRFRTLDPDKAHVYFLPFSITKMVQFIYVPNSHDITPIKKAVIDYVDVIGSKYPFWNRSLGADHFMLSCHDWGPMTSGYIPNLYKNSIRALCNANSSEGFRPSKDVSIPEINLKTGDTNGWIGGPSPSHRPILAFFAGGLHGPIRPVLLEHWLNKDDDIKVYQYLPKRISYQEMMKKSKYCICPSGYEVASPRIVEAIYGGCVPVLISDSYVLPFSDVLNWKSFSVQVSVDEIPNLKKILMGISQRQYIKMQRRGSKVLRHFEVNSPPKRFDVFHMTLHSIWLRRLNVKIHEK